MYFIYILQSLKTGEFYKGLTSDLNSRLSDHSKGRSAYTRKILPLRLIHVEICDSRIEARKLEKYFKSGYGREIIKELSEVIWARW